LKFKVCTVKKILLVFTLILSACHSTTMETGEEQKVWVPCDVWGCDKIFNTVLN
jgi:hypothetical protein